MKIILLKKELYPFSYVYLMTLFGNDSLIIFVSALKVFFNELFNIDDYV